MITWNPSDKSNKITLSNGNRTVSHTGTSSHGGVRATGSKSSGKWYWEISFGTDPASSCLYVGIGTSSAPLESQLGGDAHGYSYKDTDGKKYHLGSGVNYGSTFTAGDIIGVALDLDAGKLWWAKANAWQASGNPAAGTNEAYNGISGTFFPMHMSMCNGLIITANFNANDQTYSPPSGFEPICPGAVVVLESAISAQVVLGGALQIDIVAPSFPGGSSLSVTEAHAGIVTAPTFTGSAMLRMNSQVEIACGLFSASGHLLETKTQIDIVAASLRAVSGLSCDGCLNYAQIAATCPTPTSDISMVFRNARIDAEVPALSDDGRLSVGKRIEGGCPGIECTCIAYSGRYPPLEAEVPAPTASLSAGLNLDGEIKAPSADIVADTHNVASIHGFHPSLGFVAEASSDNVATLSATIPAFRGILDATVGNVASIIGNVPHLTAYFQAINGESVSISGSVPPPHPVRIHAGLTGDAAISGDVPVPTMRSQANFLEDRILRHIRGKVR